jgi:hypothetical protein
LTDLADDARSIQVMTEEIDAGEPKLEVGPVGLAAFAAALAGEWDTVEDDMEEVVAARQEAADRQTPDLA